jgi:hypothetical protein
MLPIRLNAFQYIIRVLHGKYRLHNAVGVEGVTPDFKVDLIRGRRKCAYVGCIVEVSKIYVYIYIFFSFFCGAVTQRGSRPPHSWGF